MPGAGRDRSTPGGGGARHRCGRIENAPRDSWVILDRSADGGRTWAWVAESVDAGISYAYTMAGNNLSGRVSRGALACGNGQVLARTSWY